MAVLSATGVEAESDLAFAGLDRIGPARAEGLARQAAEAIRPIMRPYRPVVVFLAGQVT